LSQEEIMARPDMRAPNASVTLAQGEVLAPLALAIANLLIGGVDRVVRLFARG